MAQQIVYTRSSLPTHAEIGAYADQDVDEGGGSASISPQTTLSGPDSTARSRKGADDFFLPAEKRRRVVYLCEPCGTSYTEKRALARHRHTDTHRNNTGQPPAQKYACSICGREFSRDHDRLRHENEKHRGIKRTGPRSQKTEESPASSSALGKSGSSVDPENHGNDADLDNEPLAFSDVTPGSSMTPPQRTVAADQNPHDPHQCSWFVESDNDEEDLVDDEHRREVKEGGKFGTRNKMLHRNLSGRGVERRRPRSRDEETAHSTPNSRNGSTATADSAIDMSLDAQHEAKYPTITTYDYRSNSDPTPEVLHGKAEGPTKTLLPLRPHTSVIQRRGKAQVVAPQKALYCILCDDAFEDDCNGLLQHLRRHLDNFTSKIPCPTCKIYFVHKEDLKVHLTSAQVFDHCGFKFDHKYPCTGHHPPKPSNTGMYLSDWDSFRLYAQLRNWEQAQLKAYIANIRDLLATRNGRASQVFSVEALAGSSRNSFASYAISVKTLGSAPCDETVNGQRDVGGLQQRMLRMSLSKGGTSLVRPTPKKLPPILQGGGIDDGLYKAACKGDRDHIRRLMTMGADLSAIVNGQTILSTAAEKAGLDTVEYLIEMGADVNADDPKHGSALGSAAYWGNVPVVEYLLVLGADIAQKSPMPGCPLSSAAAGGNIACVKLLLERGACVNQAGGLQGSPLGFAVWNHQLDVVRLLLDRGADVNTPGSRHGSALCIAISRLATSEGRLDLVQLLLERGAKVDAAGASWNALYEAASHADVPAMADVVRLLMMHGADVALSGLASNALSLVTKQWEHWLNLRTIAGRPDEKIDERIMCCERIIGLLHAAGAEDGSTRDGDVDMG